MTTLTDAAILARAAELLAAGVLASVLPARLMEEFDLSPDRARRLAQQALERRRANDHEEKSQFLPGGTSK